ncbi:MAG: RNA-binding S4 domain-containing protein [Bacteroidales bacterium]|nr:RNA-binding S4 domain-containing protein [Bacteroidales bacterium]
MDKRDSVRIDKFLWSVRIYKTRGLASEACRRGRVAVNNMEAKPSRIVSEKDIITVKKLPVIYTFRVLQPVGNRVSAKIAASFIEDLTSAEEKLKRQIGNSLTYGHREKGSGRPTKKERRNIDRMNNNISGI